MIATWWVTIRLRVMGLHMLHILRIRERRMRRSGPFSNAWWMAALVACGLGAEAAAARVPPRFPDARWVRATDGPWIAAAPPRKIGVCPNPGSGFPRWTSRASCCVVKIVRAVHREDHAVRGSEHAGGVSARRRSVDLHRMRGVGPGN